MVKVVLVNVMCFLIIIKHEYHFGIYDKRKNRMRITIQKSRGIRCLRCGVRVNTHTYVPGFETCR